MIAARKKRIVLLVAMLLLAAALLWTVLLNKNGAAARMARAINTAYGYNLLASDFSAVDEWENTSIRALLPNDDLAAITEASIAAGLPSDVDRVGTVLLVMANTVEDEILTLFYVEGTLELGFVQYKGSDAIHALGAAPASTPTQVPAQSPAHVPAQTPEQAQTSAS